MLGSSDAATTNVRSKLVFDGRREKKKRSECNQSVSSYHYESRLTDSFQRDGKEERQKEGKEGRKRRRGNSKERKESTRGKEKEKKMVERQKNILKKRKNGKRE